MRKIAFLITFFFLLFSGCKDDTKVSKMPKSEPLPVNSGSNESKDGPQVDSEESEMIKVEQPVAGKVVSSPLHVEGKARGSWFFEGQAGYEIIDSEGKQLAQGAITAKGNWMTEDYVAFTADIQFEVPKRGSGFLILKKANPSGKPENEASLRIPISFKE